MSPLTVYTIGHSIRPITEFLAALKNFGIAQLIDVRTIPQSRYNPQYGQAALAQALETQGIPYEHMPGLGGLRKPQKESINDGLRNASFRGYADYMQSAAFQKNLEKLMITAGKRKTAIMCAEAVPWRCHRSLISDALTIQGCKVINIMDAGHQRGHILNPLAQAMDTGVCYPKSFGESGQDMIKA